MDKKLNWVSIILTTVGVLIAVYMTIYKWTANNAMCLGSGDCSTVNASPYSQIYGIPVALVGVFGYFAILFLLLFNNRFGKFVEQNHLYGIFGLTVTGFIFTVYLVYLEAFIIKAFCPFCVASQITMTILFIISCVRLVRQPVN